MAALRTIALNFGGGGGCMRRDCHHRRHRGAVCSGWFRDRIAIAVVVCSEWFRDRTAIAVVVVVVVLLVVVVFVFGRCFVYFISRFA